MRFRKRKVRNSSAAGASTARLVGAVAAALSVPAWSDHAEAALIAQFTGTVTSVSSPLAGGFDVGETVTGFYRFDETTPDTNGAVNAGTYVAIDDYQVQLSGGYAASAAAGEIGVGLPVTGAHRYRVDATSPSGPNVSGFALTGIVILLEDSSQTAFGSPALPVSLDLGDFDFRLFGLIFGEDFVEAELTTFAIIPEPATATLLGLSGLALIWRRRGYLTPG